MTTLAEAKTDLAWLRRSLADHKKEHRLTASGLLCGDVRRGCEERTRLELAVKEKAAEVKTWFDPSADAEKLF